MHYSILIITNFVVDIPVAVDEGVLAASISFSVNLFRPYVHRPVEVTSTIVSVSSIPEKLPMTDDSNDQVSISLRELAHSPVSQDEMATEDKLDGGMIVKNTITVDEEIVKRRWYREEMRQSPVSSFLEALD